VFGSKSVGDRANNQGSRLVTTMIDTFMRWWNLLAQRNGTLKFRNQREAAEFVRRVQNENGGPNAKIMAMRQRYVEVNRAKTGRTGPRFDEGHNRTVLG
jgi:hypothetical protein